MRACVQYLFVEQLEPVELCVRACVCVVPVCRAVGACGAVCACV